MATSVQGTLPKSDPCYGRVSSKLTDETDTSHAVTGHGSKACARSGYYRPLSILATNFEGDTGCASNFNGLDGPTREKECCKVPRIQSDLSF